MEGMEGGEERARDERVERMQDVEWTSLAASVW